MPKFEDLDKNFKQTKVETENPIADYKQPCAPFDLYGVYYDETEERFVRMPKSVAAQVNDGVADMYKHTSGGRIRFSTDSDYFGITVEYSDLIKFSHMPLSGSCGFVLIDETDEVDQFVSNMRPEPFGNDTGFKGTTWLKSDKIRNYVLYLPTYNDVKSLTIHLKNGAYVGGGKAYKDIKPILYYGSSITHGGCASRPDNMYPARVERWTNIDFIDLGFSGSARGEEVMVDYLASIDCSVFVCDYDHNAPNPEHLENTHFALYERYRAKKPNTPIVFITRPDIECDGSCPKRKEVIYATYKKAKKLGDKKVYFIDGGTFFKGVDRSKCTVDGCHPNDLGFEKMAKVVKKKLTEIFAKM